MRTLFFLENYGLLFKVAGEIVFVHVKNPASYVFFLLENKNALSPRKKQIFSGLLHFYFFQLKISFAQHWPMNGLAENRI